MKSRLGCRWAFVPSGSRRLERRTNIMTHGWSRHFFHADMRVCQACSLKTEFTFLKGNLIAPASELLIFNRKTVPRWWKHGCWQFDSGQRRATVIPSSDDGQPVKQDLVNDLKE
jgi:hypothetical protein